MSGEVYLVSVEGRLDGAYVFEHADAQEFADAVRANDGRADFSCEPLNDRQGARELIEVERDGEVNAP